MGKPFIAKATFIAMVLGNMIIWKENKKKEEISKLFRHFSCSFRFFRLPLSSINTERKPRLAELTLRWAGFLVL